MASYDGKRSDRAKARVVNQEPLYVNKYIHQALVQRKYEIHRERVHGAKPVTATRFDPDRFRFMENRISKNYQIKMRTLEVSKGNLNMLHRIDGIRRRQGPLSKLRPHEEPRVHMRRLKEHTRQMEQQRIRDENRIYFDRWHNPKPYYSSRKFKEGQHIQEKWLVLRSTDHTAGHILEPVKRRPRKGAAGAPSATSTSSVLSRSLDSLGGGAARTGRSASGFGSRTLGGPPVAFLHSDLFSGSTETVPELKYEFFVDPNAVGKRPGAIDSSMSADSYEDDLEDEDDDAYDEEDYYSEDEEDGTPTGTSDQQSRRLSGRRGSGHSRSQAGRRHSKRSAGHGRDTPSSRCSDLSDDHGSEAGLVALAARTVPHGAVNYVVRIFAKVHEFDENMTLRLFDAADDELLDERLVSVDDAFEVANSDKAANTQDDDLGNVRTMLVNLFHEVDKERNGTLTFSEFARLMRKINLGISEPELRFVMAEADENEDGLIDYNEYIPLAVDIIQAFRARKRAHSKVSRMDAELDAQLAEQLNVDELDMQATELLSRCKSLDPRNMGALRPIDIRAVVHDKKIGLSPVEANLLLHTLPRDAFGRVSYRNMEECLFEVRYRTLKNAMLEAQGSGLQRYLMELCGTEEARTKDSSGGDGPQTGWLSMRQFVNVLVNSPRLSMSRTQVMVVVSDADVVDGMINYWQFVPTAAKTIEMMFDPKTLRQRAQLIEDTDLSPEVLLRGASPETFQRRLKTLFKSHDVDRSGELDPQEFRACLESLDLHLGPAEILALMANADADGSGTIDFEEFAEFCTTNLLNLERERHLRILQDKIHGRSSLDGDGDGSGTASAEENIGLDDTEHMEGHMRAVFESADKDNSGKLSDAEFKDVLDRLDLGLTDFQFNVLMSELDMNEDGDIDYEEFVPACAQLIETFQAKRGADDDLQAKEQLAERHVNEVWPTVEHEIDAVIGYVERMISADNDPSKFFQQLLNEKERNGGLMKSRDLLDDQPRHIENSPSRSSAAGEGASPLSSEAYHRRRMPVMTKRTIKRAKLETYLRDPHTHLTRSQVNLVMAELPIVEGHGSADVLVSYDHLGDVLRKVHRMQLKRYFLEDHDPNNIMKQLVELIQATAREALEEEQSVSDGSHPVDVPDYVPLPVIFDAMGKYKGIPLSHAQLLAIISWSDCFDAMGQNADYRRFAAYAAEMMGRMFSVAENKKKSQIAVQQPNTFSESSIMNSLLREDLDEYLLDAFNEHDPHRSEYVSEAQLSSILRGVPLLHLSPKQVTSILASLPHAKNRDKGMAMLHWPRFFVRAYDTLYQLLYHEKMQRRITLYDVPAAAPQPTIAEGGGESADSQSVNSHVSQLSGFSSVQNRIAELRHRSESAAAEAEREQSPALRLARSMLQRIEVSTNGGEARLMLPGDEVVQPRRSSSLLCFPLQSQLSRASMRAMNSNPPTARNSESGDIPEGVVSGVVARAAARIRIMRKRPGTPAQASPLPSRSRHPLPAIDPNYLLDSPLTPRSRRRGRRRSSASPSPFAMRNNSSGSGEAGELGRESEAPAGSSAAPARSRPGSGRPEPVRKEPMFVCFFASMPTSATLQALLARDDESTTSSTENAHHGDDEGSVAGGSGPLGKSAGPDELQRAIIAARLEGSVDSRDQTDQAEAQEAVAIDALSKPPDVDEAVERALLSLTLEPELRVRLRHAESCATWEGVVPVQLPSIGLVDENAARQVAANLLPTIVLEEDEAGNRTVGLREVESPVRSRRGQQ